MFNGSILCTAIEELKDVSCCCCLPGSNTPVSLQLVVCAKFFNNCAVIAPFRLVSSSTAKATCIHAAFGRGAPRIAPPARRSPPTTARAASQSLASRFGNAVWAFSGEPTASLETRHSEWGCNTHRTQSRPNTQILLIKIFFSLKTLFHTYTTCICHFLDLFFGIRT